MKNWFMVVFFCVACNEDDIPAGTITQKVSVDGVTYQIYLKTNKFKSMDSVAGFFVVSNFHDSTLTRSFSTSSPVVIRLKNDNGETVVVSSCKSKSSGSSLILKKGENFLFELRTGNCNKKLVHGKMMMDVALAEDQSPVLSIPIEIE